MPTLPCPDCGHPTSIHAAACPHCGRPNGNLPPSERTAKRLKLQQIIGFLICLASIAFFLFRMAHSAPILPPAILFTIGLAWLITIRFYIWWHHE